MNRIPILLCVAGMLSQCKSSGTTVVVNPNRESRVMDDEVQNRRQAALLLGNDESILAVSIQDARMVHKQVGLALAESSDETLTPEDSLLIAQSVMAAVDDRLTPDGGDTFDLVSDDKYEAGGPLRYLTNLSPETYFKVVKWKNEFMVKHGWQSPYHHVSGGNTAQFKYKQDYLGSDISLREDGVFTYHSYGVNLEGKNLNLFLGILPSEEIVRIIRTDPQYSNESLAKMLEGSGTLQVESAFASESNTQQSNTPDNQPLSIRKIFVGVKYIDDGLMQGENVYIHCKRGVSRIATLVAAWYVKHYGMSAAQAAEFVKERRPEVSIGKSARYHQLALEDFEIAWKMKQGQDTTHLMKAYKIDATRNRNIQRGIK